MPKKRAGNPTDGGDTVGKTEAAGDCGPVSGDTGLGHALFRVMRAIMFDDQPDPLLDALPLAQLRLLWTVHQCREATMKDFSERLRVSQSTVTQLADRLVRRGLVDRLSDNADRRIVRLRTSKAGQALLGSADQARRRTLRSVWDKLSDSERLEIVRSLETLGSAAEQVREDEGRPLPPLPDRNRQAEGEDLSSAPRDASQPVVDLMARRVRGRSASD